MDKIEGTARIVSYGPQPAQPDADDDRTLADHDLRFLCGFLGDTRSQSYELLERPDQRIRNSSAPDYLMLETPSQRTVAIERTTFMDQDLQAAKARLVRRGANVIVIGPRSIDPVEVCDALSMFLERKLARAQAVAVDADERMLLIRNRVLATDRTFMSSTFLISEPARSAVDHCFLIARGRLLELW